MATVTRNALLEAGETFVRRVVHVRGVERVALIGSITTEKPNPKDIDFLLTVSDSVDMEKVAAAGRKLKGLLQSRSSGADLFLCNKNHQYIGRACSHRECHFRAACAGTKCGPGSWVENDFHVVNLAPELCSKPPVILWPAQEIAASVPEDVVQWLERLDVELGSSA